MKFLKRIGGDNYFIKNIFLIHFVYIQMHSFPESITHRSSTMSYKQGWMVKKSTAG